MSVKIIGRIDGKVIAQRIKRGKIKQTKTNNTLRHAKHTPFASLLRGVKAT